MKTENWTVPAAAAHLGVSERTVWRWIRGGKLKAVEDRREVVTRQLVKVILVPDVEVRRAKEERGRPD